MNLQSIKPVALTFGCFLIGYYVARNGGHTPPESIDPDYLIGPPSWSDAFELVLGLGGASLVGASLMIRSGDRSTWIWWLAPLVAVGAGGMSAGVAIGLAARPVIGANIGGVLALITLAPLSIGLIVAAIWMVVRRRGAS